jgi:ribosomal protein S14
MTGKAQDVHAQFVKALQREPVQCQTLGCSGLVDIHDLSQLHDKVKTFGLRCQRCGREDRVTGKLEEAPPWDDAALLMMADEHLMHQQPICPFDHTPVVFTSLPNPRRRARYRLSCFYCGRHAELDWPPQESRR